MRIRKTIFGNIKCDFRGLGYDVSLEAILKRGCELKYKLPEETKRMHLNQLIIDLKSNGIWDKQDYILNFAYNDSTLQNFALINLKNPNFGIAEIIGAMNYNGNGFKGNVTNASILTPFNLLSNGVNYTLNDAGRGAVVYADGSVTAANRLIDYHTSGLSRMTNSNAVQHRINSGSTSLPTAVNLAGIGYKGIFRINSTTVELNNKAVRTSNVSNSTSVDSSGTMRLFSVNTSNSGDIGISFYHIGASLTNLEVQAFRTIYNNYLTAIGLTANS